jgi:signal transduction histidine kinase
MKRPSILLAGHYVVALKEHLEGSSPANGEPALPLGRQSLAVGLQTLDLARIHEQAMATLFLPDGSSKTRRVMSKRADVFFARANAVLADTHRTAGRSELDWQELNAALVSRTGELAAVNAELQQGVAERKLMQDAHDKRGKLHHKCLEESMQLQTRLRQLTHRLFAAQEDERQKISRELEDEIAQTLLATNVSLLALKQEIRNNTEGFQQKITSTQRLVVQSVRTVRQAARKVGKE